MCKSEGPIAVNSVTQIDKHGTKKLRGDLSSGMLFLTKTWSLGSYIFLRSKMLPLTRKFLGVTYGIPAALTAIYTYIEEAKDFKYEKPYGRTLMSKTCSAILNGSELFFILPIGSLITGAIWPFSWWLYEDNPIRKCYERLKK